MHRLSTNFVLGYHGCDREVGEAILANKSVFRPSQNEWDWLGEGIYFWESNPLRGLEFAQLLKKWRPGREHSAPINEPFVIGAAIDLGYCLDLATSTGVQLIAALYRDFEDVCTAAGIAMPENKGGNDLVFRNLDSAVINHLHRVRVKQGAQPFDTIKAVFIEGSPIYEKSGFFEKTHIQIAVRSPACIKGVFRVPAEQLRGA